MIQTKSWHSLYNRHGVTPIPKEEWVSKWLCKVTCWRPGRGHTSWNSSSPPLVLTLASVFSYPNDHPPLTLSPAGSSSVAAWMAYAKKQRKAPIHSRMEKPPNSWRQNLTHSGVVGGGVRALGPSLARYSAALALVKPWVGNEGNNQLLLNHQKKIK